MSARPPEFESYTLVVSGEETRALAESDPSVQAGRMAVDVMRWLTPKRAGVPASLRLMREAADEPELRFAVVEALEKVPGLQAQEAEQAVAGRPRRQRQRLPPAARGALEPLCVPCATE